MKIELEFDERMEMKMRLSPAGMPWVIAMGLLKLGLEDCILKYRLTVLDQREKEAIAQQATVKPKKSAKGKGGRK